MQNSNNNCGFIDWVHEKVEDQFEYRLVSHLFKLSNIPASIYVLHTNVLKRWEVMLRVQNVELKLQCLWTNLPILVHWIKQWEQRRQKNLTEPSD